MKGANGSVSQPAQRARWASCKAFFESRRRRRGEVPQDGGAAVWIFWHLKSCQYKKFMRGSTRTDGWGGAASLGFERASALVSPPHVNCLCITCEGPDWS